MRRYTVLSLLWLSGVHPTAFPVEFPKMAQILTILKKPQIHFFFVENNPIEWNFNKKSKPLTYISLSSENQFRNPIKFKKIFHACGYQIFQIPPTCCCSTPTGTQPQGCGIHQYFWKKMLCVSSVNRGRLGFNNLPIYLF